MIGYSGDRLLGVPRHGERSEQVVAGNGGRGANGAACDAVEYRIHMRDDVTK